MEYRVKFFQEENDCYVELWKVVGKQAYIARYTYGPKRWCRVSDPLGYCELDSAFNDEAVFIVCDSKGKELFRTRNGDGTSDFNTPKQEAFAQWANYCKAKESSVKVENSSVNFYLHWATGTPAGDLNQWLLSFQDPDLYPAAKDFPENWVYVHCEQVGEPKILHKYDYLGEQQVIELVHFRHKVCGVEWDKCYSGGYYIGAAFDKTRIGTMYPESQAKSIITEAIRTHFPKHTAAVSYVEMNGWPGEEKFPIQRNVRITSACEHILNGDYHREFVDRLAVEERAQSHFYLDGYRGIAEIREKYPDCIEDHNFII